MRPAASGSCRSWQETYGLAPADWPAFRETVREAVADGPLTRQELSAAVGRRRRFRDAAAGLTSNSDTLLKSLMWQGDLCFGPARDGEATVQSLHRVARWAGLPSVDEAGRRAVEAYVRTYGPTTADSVQYYLGAGLSAGRKALRGWLDDLSDRLVAVDVDGEDLLVSVDDVDDLTSTDVLPHRSPAAGRRPVGDGTGHRRPPRGPSCPSPAGDPRRQPRRSPAASWPAPGRARRAPSPSPGSARPTRPITTCSRAEAARLAAILGTELDLNVTAG